MRLQLTHNRIAKTPPSTTQSFRTNSQHLQIQLSFFFMEDVNLWRRLMVWGKAAEGYYSPRFQHDYSVTAFCKICMSDRYIELYEHDEMHLYHR